MILAWIRVNPMPLVGDGDAQWWKDLVRLVGPLFTTDP